MTSKRRPALARRRRTITYLWIGSLAIITIALIYWEMTAVLYILATLSVAALLVVVAAADLAGAEKQVTDVVTADDAAAIGSGITSTFGARKS
ncbi:MAG TPA: hypothetical protein VI750_04540 [Pyrinomonadaceae bacterium]|nr:hypothetical protein [Pyrinomonadaceae bacterium]HLE62382.1 hypothetical protein [Pyrinomonadaceae bacterium]